MTTRYHGLTASLLALAMATTVHAQGITDMKKGEGGSAVQGSAGPGGAQNAASDLERCDKPMATIAVSESSFERPQNIIVLHSISGENIDPAIVHSGGHTDNHGPVRPAQSNSKIGIKSQLGSGDIELVHGHVAGFIAPFSSRHIASLAP